MSARHVGVKLPTGPAQVRGTDTDWLEIRTSHRPPESRSILRVRCSIEFVTLIKRCATVGSWAPNATNSSRTKVSGSRMVSEGEIV